MDLGPFKHRIDDGLELRKAAFECLDILLTELPHVLQVQYCIHAWLVFGGQGEGVDGSWCCMTVRGS